MARPQPKQRLLIVDTSPQNIDDLKAILATDYDINFAADGMEAIQLAASPDPPGLILLSTMIPAMDAYEVCKTLKADQNTKNIPILLISEPTTKDTQARGFELGAADYITTPFKKSVISARIRNHLELKRYRDNLDNRVKKLVSDLHEEIQQRRDIEDTYRALVEHARDGIVVVHDFEVRFANPAFCRLVGFSEKELIGAHLKKFISEEEFIKNTTRYSHRIGGLNLPRIYKSQVIHSDGSIIDVELNVCVVPYGRSLAALVFVRDIREEEGWKYFLQNGDAK
jgi:PAS domain S-box-containing protein